MDETKLAYFIALKIHSLGGDAVGGVFGGRLMWRGDILSFCI